MTDVLNDQRVAAYRKLLEKHDWRYEYSDDHGRWLAGKREREALVKLQQKLDPDKVIWLQYDPG